MKLKDIWKKIEWQFVLLLARRLPDCKIMTKRFSESLDRKMSSREKTTMRLHLYTCEACRRYVRQINQMHDSLKQLKDVLPTPTPKTALSDEARERIKARLAARSK